MVPTQDILNRRENHKDKFDDGVTFPVDRPELGGGGSEDLQTGENTPTGLAQILSRFSLDQYFETKGSIDEYKEESDRIFLKYPEINSEEVESSAAAISEMLIELAKEKNTNNSKNVYYPEELYKRIKERIGEEEGMIKSSFRLVAIVYRNFIKNPGYTDFDDQNNLIENESKAIYDDILSLIIGIENQISSEFMSSSRSRTMTIDIDPDDFPSDSNTL